MQEYIIKPGDTFFQLAQRLGCSCQDLENINPTLNPNLLKVGQKIVLPEVKDIKGQFLAEVSHSEGQEFMGQNFDDVQVEIEGVKFRVKRVGEHRTPHEVHLILPRTEIHKIEQGPNGNSELQLMISNINIVNSPRLMSEGGDRAETPEGTATAAKTKTTTTTTPTNKNKNTTSTSSSSSYSPTFSNTEAEAENGLFRDFQPFGTNSIKNARESLSDTEDESKTPNGMLSNARQWFGKGKLFKRAR